MSWAQSSSGLLVPEASLPAERPVAVELFAGAGGMGLGFHMAGWHVAAAVEWDLAAACTYLANLGGPDTIVHRGPGTGNTKRERAAQTGWTHGRAEDFAPGLAGTGWISHRGRPHRREDWGNDYLYDINKPPAWDEPACAHLWICDVRELDGQAILDALGMDRGDVDAVTGGPPCQGFSIAGQRNVMDPRNSLVFDFARIVLEINPKTMCMENVPGIVNMLTPEGVPVLDALARVLEDGGWSTYDALRKTLAAQAGLGALRRDMPVAKKGARPVVPGPDPEPDLFSEVSA